jgi:3-deoxy-manno-octulosonate cytidylyltransferase (CMP-KDO synthetase)
MKNKKDTIAALIPARYGSTRFPGKALADIKGRPMIQWVYERTKRSKLIDRVIVATDDQRILRAVRSFGGEAMMTSSHHATGTDRIAEVARSLDCAIVVNVQGDEPLIQPAMIDEAISPLVHDASIPMGTLCRKIEDRNEAFDPNVVKVVFDKNNFALYFSRAPIPWDRDSWAGKGSWKEFTLGGPLYKHIGIYVYRRDFLLNYSRMPQTALEDVEKLEQLRALEHGFRIKTVVTEHDSFGVDIPDDLSKILARIEES